MHVGSLEASAVLGHEEWDMATWRGSGRIMVGKTQRAALPDAAHCVAACSTLQLRMQCTASEVRQ